MSAASDSTTVSLIKKETAVTTETRRAQRKCCLISSFCLCELCERQEM